MNTRLYNFISKSIDEEKLPHAFLIESNNINETVNRIFNIFYDKNIIDKKNDVRNNISVKLIEPENKLIDKSKIEDLSNFVISKPLVGLKKIYFILNAELMNTTCCNKILKTLEEPSEYVVAFLITENLDNIIPTIKSRTEIFTDKYDVSEDKEGIFITKIKDTSFENITNIKKELTSLSKEDLINVLINNLDYINSNIFNERYVYYYKIIDDTLKKIKYNVNVDLSIDCMFISLLKKEYD